MSLAPEGAHRRRGAKHALPSSASTGLRKWTRAQANATHVGDSPTGKQLEKPANANAVWYARSILQGCILHDAEAKICLSICLV
jgi:hypothetical protein